jgi:spore coat polysaccharide biosynthesis predicted glycosyltransferase SpsG
MVGGSDSANLTPWLASWVASALPGVPCDIVVGPLADQSRLNELNANRDASSFALHINPVDIRALMLAADLALCGGGQTLFELAATGTPAIAIRIANNQSSNLRGFSEAGAIEWAGDAGDLDLESKVTHLLVALASDMGRRARLGSSGRALIDGKGCSRVAKALLDTMAGEKQ